MNYKERDPSLYKQICSLPIGETIKFTPGSSDIISSKHLVKVDDRGRPNKFVQGKEPSCLFLSLTNALYLSGEE